MLRDLRQMALHFCIASGLMILAFLLCQGLHDLSRIFGNGAMQSRMHAVFLPFGVIVLMVWVYGWVAMLMVLPAAILSTGMIIGLEGMTALVLLVLVAKVLAVPVAFALFRVLGMDARGEGQDANWKAILLVGLAGSLIGNVPRVLIGPCCGEMPMLARAEPFLKATAADMAGLVLVLLAAMTFFRVLRHG